MTDMTYDIKQISLTSRSSGNQLDLALATESGLFFASLAFASIGRTTQFSIKLSEDNFLFERIIASCIEYEPDKFVVLVQEIKSVAFLDRKL